MGDENGEFSCFEKHERDEKDLLQFIKGLNEIIILVDNDREIVAASKLGTKLLGIEVGSKDRSKIDDYFPKVYIDAVIARSKYDDIADKGLNIPVKGSNGKEIVLDVRFNWVSTNCGDLLALMCRDISGFLEIMEYMTNREDLYRTIFHDSPMGFVHVNSDGILTDCNAAFLSIFGFERSEVIGVCLAEENNLAIYPRFKLGAMDAVMGSDSRHESRFSTSDGAREGWVRVSFSPVKSEKFIFFGAVGIVEDITERKLADEKVQFVSSHDVLTGIHNRRACEEALISLNNPDNLPLALIYADLNCLKLANDAFGHQEGDILLKSASEILRKNSESKGLAYRWGGDEFVVLLKNTSRTEAEEILKNMTRMCDSWEGDGLIRPSMSLGLSVKTFQEQDLDGVMKDAEDAMYAQKIREGGRTRAKILEALEARMHNLEDAAIDRKCQRMIKWGEWAIEKIFSGPGHEALRLLFRYHDIGLLACPEEIHTASRDPSTCRVATLLQHAVVGYRIARSIAEIAYIADSILYHHEWWDGMGYPSQLSGDEIPFSSRIVSIFDSIEGMINFGSDGQGLPLESALTAIEACAGKQFDPSLTRDIVHKLRDDPPGFAQEI
jgi:diguanylate cyclase (GGDEF)-like protein/PAS domain S-box-containing protein